MRDGEWKTSKMDNGERGTSKSNVDLENGDKIEYSLKCSLFIFFKVA